MRGRFRRGGDAFVADSPFDTWVYRFFLCLLLVGFVSTGIRLILSLRSRSIGALPYDGAPMGLVFFGSLAFILLWRPQTLSIVAKTLYVVGTLGMIAKLVYLLFGHASQLYLQFFWTFGWMSVSYVVPYMIFPSRIAARLSSLTFGVWVFISGLYALTHFGTVQTREILVVLSQTYAAHGILIMFLGLYSRVRGQALQMERIAHTDFLLGTANRRSVQAALGNELTRVSEMGKTLSVILMDVDRFKDINDKYGHSIGDAVLVELASVVSSFISPPHFFGRWGGEEFLLVLPNSNEMESYIFADRVRNSIEANGFDVGHVTASFGVAEFRVGDTLDSLLKRVDEALYKCKRLGRNRVEITG